MKRLKIIACKVLYREISYLTAKSENFVDVTYMRQGLHDTPSLLKEALQKEIDLIDADDDLHTFHSHFVKREFDAILLGYGLCSNGVEGLRSEKHTLVVPRAHDCITLFLGAKEKYNQYFNGNPGTFWYNASWIENSSTPSEETEKEMYAVYSERYGEENAQYLIDAELTENYNRCAYIRWDELPFPKYEKYAQDAAEFYGWEYDCVLGNSGLMRDFIDGNWSEDKFLVVPPGKTIAAEHTENIIKVE